MKSKFFLKRLVLGGNNKKNAILNFEEGLMYAGHLIQVNLLRLIVLTMDLDQVMCLHYHQKQKGTIVCILK